MKGVFSKPSGNCIVVPNLCFLSAMSLRRTPKDFENIQFPTSHLEAENPLGLVTLIIQGPIQFLLGWSGQF